MNPIFTKWGVPAIIILVGALAALSLPHLDRTVKVTEQGVPVQPAAPVLPPPQPGQEQAYPGRNNPAPVPVPGGVFVSLDKINAASKAVGCPVLAPGDPAVRLIEVAECLGEKAIRR